ncbi:MAG: hypothetical protein KDB18_11600 [Salinibacterium sp.]|nr:hypothetical protein [Myxococcales bacterium]MCB1282154.1 hypothetical protein [Salinibacterium sp.]
MRPLLADLSPMPFDATSPYWLTAAVLVLTSLALAAVWVARRGRLRDESTRPPSE